MENIKLPDSFVKYSEEEYSYDSAEQASFRDGAKAMLTAVEKILRKHIEICEDTARITPWNYTQTHEIINYKKKTYETLLTELKTIKPL